MTSDPWTPVDIEPGTKHVFHLGSTRLHVRRTRSEWQVRREPPLQPVPVRREDKDRHRWAAPENSNRVTLVPGLPDRPLVVRPSAPFRIPVDVTVNLFVSIPMYAAVEVGDGVPLVIHPSRQLSGTWFGEPDNGELCYALKTELAHRPEDAPSEPWLALCPVTLENGGSETVELERLFLRTEHLPLLRTPTRFWTGPVQARYAGAGKPGEISYSDDLPAPEAELVTDRREPVSSNLARSGINLLRSFEQQAFRWRD